MNVRLATRLAASVAASLVLVAPAAHAVPNLNQPGASADAYALYVNLKLLATTVATPVKLGPIARASQDFPPGAANPAQAQQLQAGPVPADSSVVNHIGVMTSIAGASGSPQAVASAEAADVSLLGAGTNAKVTADLVRAQANTDCVNAPNATGTTFVNLRINGTPVENTPAPNTVYDLTVAKVILNEQHPASDGRGIVVNAIHVISTTTGDPLFRGDVVVSHAVSTVHCGNGQGSTGGTEPIQMTKSASPTSLHPGDTVTYTAAVTNNANLDCLVTAFIDHAPQGFDFVSTTGFFGTALDVTPPVVRPGGGLDLVLGNGKVLAKTTTQSQTFVLKVRDDAQPGTYFNNLEIFCANLGEWVKGLDAPVQVTIGSGPTAAPPKPQCSDGKDNDGDGKVDYPLDPGCANPRDNDERDTASQLPHTGGPSSAYVLIGIGLLAAAVVARRLRPVV